MTTIICEHCRTKNEAGAAECVACGRPLPDSPRPEQSASETGQARQDREEVERWLRQLPDFTKSDTGSLDSEDESLPAWLQAVRAHADDLTDEEAEELMEFLHDLEPAEAKTGSKPPDEDEAIQAKMTAELPDWVAALKPEEKRPEEQVDEELPESSAEAEEVDQERLPTTAELPSTSPLKASPALKGIPDRLAAEELPDWLTDQPEGQAPVEPAEDAPEWPTRPAGQSTLITASPDMPSQEEESETWLQPTRDEGQAQPPRLGHTTEDRAAEMAKQDAGANLPDDSDLAELEQALAAALDLPESKPTQEHVDQWLDLLEDLPPAEDPDQLDQLMMDSDIEGAEVPDWLRAMRLQQSAGRPVPSEQGPRESTGPLAGLTGILPAAVMGATGEARRTAATLEMSKEQRQQAALLRQLTMIEPERAPADESTEKESFLAARTILGLALVAVIALGWLLPNIGEYLPWNIEPTPPPAAELAWQAIEANRGQTALVAFEYTPSMAAELDSVASIVLDHLAQNGSPVLTVSQIAAGVPLAERATTASQELESSSLGYLPGETTGLRALGACLAQPCESLISRELSDEQQGALADVGLIIVLSADRDSLVGWVEQVGTQVDTPMVAGITQAMGPVARPYLASDQFAGLIEGMPGAAAYAGTLQVDDDINSEKLTSLIMAQWLVIGALLIGTIYFVLASPAASAVAQAAKK